MGRPATKRTAYVGNGWAMVPDEVEPSILRKVPTRVMFFDCRNCGALAGHRCLSKARGLTQRVMWCHGDRGYGKHVMLEDRINMAAGLIAAGRFDEIQILETQAVLRGAKK